MSADQIAICTILGAAMLLFVANIWRYDVVAGLALITAVFVGVVPVEHAFDGFSHPAVITVATVLVISKALQSSGVVTLFLRYMAFARGRLTSQLAANCGLTAVLSMFMNNIGALALMLPITLRDARKARRSPGHFLIPLSFASLLGGLVTLIGTPPNIIIATFRADNTGEPFSMFDFTPVGLTVAVVGIIYLVLIGWRLLPGQAQPADTGEHFQIARYITEVRIPERSTLHGKRIRDLENLSDQEAAVMAIIRQGRRRLAPHPIEKILSGDVLVLQGDSEALAPLVEDPTLVEVGAEEIDPEWLRSPDVRVIEAVVMPNAQIEGLSMRGIHMHRRFGVNLLAVSRESSSDSARLRYVKFRTGDVLLLQGETEALELMCKSLGCMAIKDRGLDLSPRRGALITPLLFALGILAAALGLVPVQIAFTSVVGALVLAKVVSLRDAYRSIEWPVIVLLGFLIPVGESLQSTGSTQLIADALLSIAGDVPAWGILAILMVASMLLSDVVHNTPTAVLMAPVAYSLALSQEVSADPYLMAVAIGAASPYLTPIGHQSNTLVMGPGGYSFGDYWRVGLPLDVLIVLTAVPMIQWVFG